MSTSKILIADDEPLNLMLYAEIFKSFGYQIITASDGLEAIQKANEEYPDLIILDWNMPRLDGLEALKKIKSDKLISTIPVMMITGIMTSSESLKLALESGAIDFIRKPFDRIELLARVKSMLLLSATNKELQEKYKIIEQSNRFVHTIIECLPQSLVFYALDGTIAGYNRNFLKQINQDEADCVGLPVSSFFAPEEYEIHQKKDSELLASLKETVYESTFGQGQHDFIISKNLIYDFSGLPSGILCVLTDVTELNQAHAEIVEIKKRELTSNALRLIQMQEMNNHMISELDKLKQYTDKPGQNIIRSLTSHFNLNTGDNYWNEFELHFGAINESFYQRLQEKHPDLTPNEKKLCALLRMNLSSKEISAITSQNPQSIDMARYRLRKKLNLPTEENLVEFLCRF